MMNNYFKLVTDNNSYTEDITLKRLKSNKSLNNKINSLPKKLSYKQLITKLIEWNLNTFEYQYVLNNYKK